MDSDLVATELATLRPLVCASPAYLARHGRPAAPEDLLQHDCITVVTAALAGPAWRFAGVRRGVALPVTGKLRTDDKDCALQATLAGIGIGIAHLASWVVSDDIVAGRLVPLFPDALGPDSVVMPTIHALRMPGRSYEAKARLFIAHLREQIGEVPYWDVAIARALTPGRRPPSAPRARRPSSRPGSP
jgi:DNA-binding transcriptional LysR family regulator